MSKIEVKELKKDEYELWDELVKNSPQGTVFHSSDWLTVCSRSLNKKLKIYGCFKNGQLVGGCSLYIYNLKFFKIASSIIEMTPYGGVVLAQSPSSKVREQEQTYNHIIKSLCNVFDNEHFDHVQLINSPDLVDVRPFIWNGWNGRVLYAYYLNLDGDIEKTISKKVRWSIKKAIKNNITVEKSTDTCLFYDLFSMTFMRQNLKPPVTKDFFEQTMKVLYSKQLGEMWIVKMPSGEAVSGEIVMFDNKRAYRWAAASHTDFRGTGATSLLLYEILQDLKKRGFKEINLMAANTPQLAKFISSFNPKLVPYYAVEKNRCMFELVKKLLLLSTKIKKRGFK